MTTAEADQPLTKKPKPDRLQCEYFITKKNRQCGMTRRHDEKYCSEHLNLLKKEHGRQLHYIGATGTNDNKGARRVPCPLDPNHTVWEYKLKTHLLKCTKGKNARMNDGKAYYIKGLNSGKAIDNVTSSGTSTSTSTYRQFLEQTIEILRRIQVESDDIVEFTIESSFKQNDIMNGTRVQELDNPKHAIQQGSLIENMYEYIGRSTGSLISRGDPLGQDSVVVVEFGCGRAEFSRYLNQQVLYRLRDNNNNNTPFQKTKTGSSDDSVDTPPLNLTYVLIDRGTNRMKFDHKIRTDTIELNRRGDQNLQTQRQVNLDIRRAKIDIRDLNLDPLLLPTNDPLEKSSTTKLTCLAISKHLCGVATDLALRCIANSRVLKSQLAGMCIAMCCRHACEPEDYINPQFVNSLLERYRAQENCDVPPDRLSYSDFFKCLAKICSWATSGRRAKIQDDESMVTVSLVGEDNDDKDEDNKSTSDDKAASRETKEIQMTVLERETLGLLARKIIDIGRLKWAQENLDGEAKLVHYVPQDVSLENVALLFRRKDQRGGEE